MSDEDWEKAGWAARWRPSDARENVPVQQGRAPAGDWFKNGQGTEMGRAQDGEHWRCKEPRCRRFAGPYSNPMDAADDSRSHWQLAHPPEERKRAREGRQTRGRSR